MKIKLNLLLLFFATLTLNHRGLAQSDDVVLRAMSDELKRNKEELVLDDIYRPFYISYGVAETSQLTMSASLGAIVSSGKTANRIKNVRVMVGDYHFNDESLDNEYGDHNLDFTSFKVPLGDDYYGIRRSFWETTDDVFRSAVKAYKNHLTYLEENDSTSEDFQSRRFAPFEARKLMQQVVRLNAVEEDIKNNIRKASGLFQNHEDLDNSGIFLSIENKTDYFIDTENSLIKTNKNIVKLLVTATTLTEDNEQIYAIDHDLADNLEYLLDQDSLQKRVNKLILDLKNRANTKKLDDSYSGPVLFMDKSAAYLFAMAVGQFYASDIEKKQNNYYGHVEQRSMDSKIGNKIAHEGLNIKLTPKLKEFEGVPLMGSYEVDSEGIFPTDEIVLVKNGRVNDVMTTRTLTKEHHASHGTGSGPGVIQINFDQQAENYDQIKSELLELVKEEGLEFGLIVKDLSLQQKMTVAKVYPDGSEEVFRDAVLGGFDIRSLRNLEMVLPKRKAHNLSLFGRDNVTSFIIPEGFLFGDIDIEPGYSNPQVKEALVPNPLSLD